MSMRPGLVLALSLVSMGALSLPAAAAQEESAANLYEQNCVRCHGSEVYTRNDRKIESLAGLQRQVQRCDTALGLRWFDDEIDQVTAYLNKNYYHFKH
jgi:mono/diheme cytochrome c family protein